MQRKRYHAEFKREAVRLASQTKKGTAMSGLFLGGGEQS